MNRFFLGVALTGFALTPHSPRAETLTGTCDVVFHADATFHSFEGTGVGEPVTVTVENGIASWQVAVTVTNLTTHKEKRDIEMFKMFRAEQYPQIRGAITGARLDDLADGMEMPLTLTIGDQSAVHTGSVSRVVREQNALAFDISWPISLKAYGLIPPKVLFIVVHDEITVTAHFALAPAETP